MWPKHADMCPKSIEYVAETRGYVSEKHKMWPKHAEYVSEKHRICGRKICGRAALNLGSTVVEFWIQLSIFKLLRTA